MSMQDLVQEDLKEEKTSYDPMFRVRFAKEWDEITGKLKKYYEKQDKKEEKVKVNESVRYSASSIEFR